MSAGKKRNPLLSEAATFVNELQAEVERAHEALAVSERLVERKEGELAALRDRCDYLERQCAYYMRFTTEVVTHFSGIRNVLSSSFQQMTGMMEACIDKARAEAHAPSLGAPAAGEEGGPAPKFLTDALKGLRAKVRSDELLSGLEATLAPNGGAGEEAEVETAGA